MSGQVCPPDWSTESVTERHRAWQGRPAISDDHATGGWSLPSAHFRRQGTCRRPSPSHRYWESGPERRVTISSAAAAAEPPSGALQLLLVTSSLSGDRHRQSSLLPETRSHGSRDTLYQAEGDPGQLWGFTGDRGAGRHPHDRSQSEPTPGIGRRVVRVRRKVISRKCIGSSWLGPRPRLGPVRPLGQELGWPVCRGADWSDSRVSR